MAIDIRQLRYFLAVAAERSFTQGARRLNMAQAPLSKRIQELEEELSVQLFDRESRPIALTAAGRLLQEEALRVVRGLDQLQATMRRFIAAERPRFVIGLVPSTLYGRLPEIIARLRKETSGVDIVLAEMDSLDQVAALKDGRIDVGFDRIIVDDPWVVHMVLREEPIVAALPYGHEFLVRGGGVSLGEIATLPLIVYPGTPRPSYADLTLSFFQNRDLMPAGIIEVRELQTALVMVASGAGACLIPESVQRLARSDIGYAVMEETVTAPFLLRRRIGEIPDTLQKLMRLYD
ncbi:LysR family transcriptional regulator [Sphingomonas nostoxanthinifaciens]|uniref:LysR family transcriptional regulator n=1 Tax=Sphingomonas nostoxanthinifaciens TaxID=2872652 RepID=UPI001CC1F5E7|nr:LysR family transcriptional regulator [Sphingomonas nostoxanthinifaciens]UAK23098.1 LysR family transcriptional regulator [Sphingomonas nostoxanthinifaciens]